MVTKSKKKKKNPEEEKIIKSACRKEAIFELYKLCEKERKGRKIIKMFLQDSNYPIDVKYKRSFLDELKKKKIINNYKLEKVEDKQSPKTIDMNEGDLDFLPFASSKEKGDMPKNELILEQITCNFIANIECEPVKTRKFLRADYKKIRERIEIETFLENEKKVLKCGRLKFGLKSGDVIYNDVLTNLLPGGQEYTLLRTLIENRNKIVEYNKLIEDIKQANSKTKSINEKDLSSIVKKIRIKLKMMGEDSENENLISAKKGYRIICNDKL